MGMGRQSRRKIKRIEDKFSAVVGRSEVMFTLQIEDIDEAKRQRYFLLK
jgi:hypothetical protein